jgi:hypothetical protein
MICPTNNPDALRCQIQHDADRLQLLAIIDTELHKRARWEIFERRINSLLFELKACEAFELPPIPQTTYNQTTRTEPVVLPAELRHARSLRSVNA